MLVCHADPSPLYPGGFLVILPSLAFLVPFACLSRLPPRFFQTRISLFLDEVSRTRDVSIRFLVTFLGLSSLVTRCFDHSVASVSGQLVHD